MIKPFRSCDVYFFFNHYLTVMTVELSLTTPKGSVSSKFGVKNAEKRKFSPWADSVGPSVPRLVRPLVRLSVRHAFVKNAKSSFSDASIANV